MSETFYNNIQIMVLNFNQRIVNGGHPLSEYEALMYEQCCRIIEAAARNLRMNVWDRKNKELEKQQEEDQ